MSEIAIRNHNHNGTIEVHSGQDQAIARLVEWAQVADAAFTMAKTLCNTQFAPVAYRNKPEEATAAILAGAEVGLSPMAALRAFDNIQGTPAPKAMTLRAIVQGQGHEVRIDESTPQRAMVSGRRKGDSDWQTSTWTIERAQQMGLTGKQQWKSQPAAMLVARATAEVCRWIASDAIMGMAYTVEELRDEGASFEARPRPQRVTAAEIIGAGAHEAAEDEQGVSVDDSAEEPAPVVMMTDTQSKRMFATFREASAIEPALNTKDGQLAYIAEVIGRQIGSRKELTADDARQITDSLGRFIAENESAQGELVEAGGQS